MFCGRQIFLSTFSLTSVALCLVMVRGCKVRTLKPMASPLHNSTGWTYFPTFFIAIPLLELSYFSVHNVLVCLWASFSSSLSCSFLCLVVLELTGTTVGVPLAQLLLVLVGASFREVSAWVWCHQSIIAYVT